MPAPREESTNDFPALQKQLILSQVQILELEDLRDELQAALSAKTQLLTELQTIADRAFNETEAARDAQIAAGEDLRASRETCSRLQQKLQTLEQEAAEKAMRMNEIQMTLATAQTTTATQLARTASLEEELQKLRASRSWRWTAPFRSIGRLFG